MAVNKNFIILYVMYMYLYVVRHISIKIVLPFQLGVRHELENLKRNPKNWNL